LSTDGFFTEIRYAQRHTNRLYLINENLNTYNIENRIVTKNVIKHLNTNLNSSLITDEQRNLARHIAKSARDS
jgi:7-cyano-7-deazaguanine synthase in queuosine biosynthesis